MGYYVNIVESTFTIPQANLAEAYERLCALNDRDDLKRGRSHPGEELTDEARKALGYHPSKWFSWLDPNYPASCPDVEAILKALGFEVSVDGGGDLCIDAYNDKTGQEEVFLAAVSDLATGSIKWQGEHGERWLEVYGGEAVMVSEAVEAWGEPTPRKLDDLDPFYGYR